MRRAHEGGQALTIAVIAIERRLETRKT